MFIDIPAPASLAENSPGTLILVEFALPGHRQLAKVDRLDLQDAGGVELIDMKNEALREILSTRRSHLRLAADLATAITEVLATKLKDGLQTPVFSERLFLQTHLPLKSLGPLLFSDTVLTGAEKVRVLGGGEEGASRPFAGRYLYREQRLNAAVLAQPSWSGDCPYENSRRSYLAPNLISGVTAALKADQIVQQKLGF